MFFLVFIFIFTILCFSFVDVNQAGKRLLLITNSDYQYTDKMMQHSFNRFLPNDMNWRDLFDMVRYLNTIFLITSKFTFISLFAILLLKQHIQ